MRLLLRLATALLAISGIQAQITIDGAGYLPRAPVPVAPGQLLTFYGGTFPGGAGHEATASGLPLPLSLGGVSIRANALIDNVLGGEGPTINVPILAISSEAVYNGLYGIFVNAVTVQIPFEIFPPQDDVLGIYSFALFEGSNQTATGLIELVAQPDAIHILRTGDTLVSSGYPLHPTVGPYPPVITHADGSTVSTVSPAKVGETIAIWAVGLGLPSSGTVVTGAANPSPALTTTVNVDYVFRPNSGPSMPWPPPGSSTTPSPGDSHVPAITVPAYFAPGYVGLYQVNVTVPTAPVPLQPCGGVFQSNVTVNIGGAASFDGAGICVSSQE